MEYIGKYFPELTEGQVVLLRSYADLLTSWNEKVNVVSRKDVGNLELHHFLHSLAIAKWTSFSPGTRILDLGTGGGLPGIPLAIIFGKCDFTLIDGRRKKIDVVNNIITRLKLGNVKALHKRAGEMHEKFDFVVSRAVASLDQLYNWSAPLIRKEQSNDLPNGMIALKGGDVEEEIAVLRKKTYVEPHPISAYYEEAYYADKYIVYVQG